MLSVFYQRHWVANAFAGHVGYRYPEMAFNIYFKKYPQDTLALVPDPSVDEYWEHSDNGIRKAKGEWSQYNIEVRIFYYDLYDKLSFIEAAKKLLESRPDAILTSPIFHQEALEFFSKKELSTIPYVFFNSNIPELDPLCFIGQDFTKVASLVRICWI